MDATSQPTAAIAHDDLRVLAELAMMRFPLRAAESHRLESMRAVLEAASELSRTLAAHTHCALVNFRGSHGAGDLVSETEAFSAALERYAQLVKETAGEFRRHMRPPVVSEARLPVAAGYPELLVG
jgi:hypothetical protein